VGSKGRGDCGWRIREQGVRVRVMVGWRVRDLGVGKRRLEEAVIKRRERRVMGTRWLGIPFGGIIIIYD
jgi:hypothetical protein